MEFYYHVTMRSISWHIGKVYKIQITISFVLATFKVANLILNAMIHEAVNNMAKLLFD